MVVFGFSLFMLFFAAVGMAAIRSAKKDVSDYLLAGRNVSPVAAGLSAVASNNSGFMFIGAIGFTYSFGYSAIWLLFAWVAGDYVSWFFVHKKLRERSGAQDAQSLSTFLAYGSDKTKDQALQRVLGLVTLIFLSLYAAAQFRAGAKALEGSLHWPPSAGIFVAAFLVLVYSYAGGIRASIWTDIAQAWVMLIAMFGLLCVCHFSIVDIGSIHSRLISIDPALTAWTPPNATLGLIPYALGWFLAGFGGIGQPHIIIRAMTLRDPEEVGAMRRTYFTWYVLFSICTLLVGLYAKILFSSPGMTATVFDAELALPRLALHTLPGFFVGVILAAMFAATVSTADSQVLACSASVTQDIVPGRKDDYSFSKMSTVGVIFFSMLVAYAGPSSVFVLVTLAWGMLSTTLAPLMLARVLNWNISTSAYFVSAALGLCAMLGWKYVLHLDDSVYEGAVGLVVTTLLLFATHSARPAVLRAST